MGNCGHKVYNPIDKNIDLLWEKAKNAHTTIMMEKVFEFRINTVLCGQSFNCLIDTGSQHNAMSRYIVNHLKLDHMVDKTMNLCFSGLIGTGVSYGIIPYINFNLNGISCPTSFVIIDNTEIHDILLGTSFMKYYKIILDFDKNTISMNGSNIPIKIIERNVHFFTK